MKQTYFRSQPQVYRKKSSFEQASAILEKAFRKYGLEDKITRYKFVSHWNDIMGEGISKRSRPEFIKNKTLYIKVADSGWAQELSFQKDIILKRLQRFLEQEAVVTDLRFIIGEI